METGYTLQNKEHSVPEHRGNGDFCDLKKIFCHSSSQINYEITYKDLRKAFLYGSKSTLIFK